MSDPILEEESLISQDDIDKLLDASSLEEAEEKLDAPRKIEEEPALDDIGELSQDDIDSLLSGSGLDTDEALPEEGGELSQDDIDSLLGGGGDDAEEVGELSQDDIDSLLGGGNNGDDEVGELSQDDIDSLLGGVVDGGEEEDAELISQDDIDSLMNGDQGSDEDDEDDELISMDDIQGLIGGDDPKDQETFVPDLDPEPEPEAVVDLAGDADAGEVSLDAAPAPGRPEPGTADPLDVVISDGDAVAVSDCLITQGAMDEMIRNAPKAGAAPDPEPEAVQDPVDLDDGDLLSGAVDMGAGPVDLDAPDDDMDSLLGEGQDDLGLDFGSEPAGDVTQEDIDALLQESDDGEDFLAEDDDILISQDDIDTLLMAADQEDEDVLGDLLGDSVDDSMDDFEAQEIVTGKAEKEPEPETDQVVLEGLRAEPAVKEAKTSAQAEKIRTLLKKKWVLAAASVLLVMGISIPIAYFLFFSSKPVRLPEKESVPVAAVQEKGREIEVASALPQDPAPLPAIRQSGTMVLADFVILTSDRAKELTYLYTDISIDYSDQRAYHEISNNLSFYRDLIYEAIQSSLVSERGNEVTESDLLWGIENSLKKVLPPHFISKISFKNFKTS